MQDLFEAQDAAGMLELFTSPLPVYSDSGITLLSNREDTELALQSLIFEARAAGVRHQRRRVLGVHPSSMGQGTMYHLEWLFLGANGSVIATSEVKYYCGRVEDGALCVLMVEYISAAFPEILAEMPHVPEVRYGLLN